MLPIARRCAIQYMFITVCSNFTAFALHVPKYDDTALKDTIMHKGLFNMANIRLMCTEEKLTSRQKQVNRIGKPPAAAACNSKKNTILAHTIHSFSSYMTQLYSGCLLFLSASCTIFSLRLLGNLLTTWLLQCTAPYMEVIGE